jgi:hypothetical protein
MKPKTFVEGDYITAFTYHHNKVTNEIFLMGGTENGYVGVWPIQDFFT